MYEMLEHFLTAFVNYSILLFEFVGIIVLLVSGIKGIYDYITHNPQIRLNLAEGMALSLEFKLGSEILRTVVVRQYQELLFVAGIILLRASLTYLIHWEIDYEEKAKAEKMRAQAIQDIEENKVDPQNARVLAELVSPPKKSDPIEKILNARFNNNAKQQKAQEKYQDQ